MIILILNVYNFYPFSFFLILLTFLKKSQIKFVMKIFTKIYSFK